MKNQKGISIISLIITIIILAIIAGIGIVTSTKILEKVQNEDIAVDMLFIQTKVKIIAEEKNFTNDESAYKGENIIGIIGNETIENLKANGVIDINDVNYDKTYVWSSQTLQDLKYDSIKLEEGHYYIVNYITEEVIYTKGFKIDGTTYYKLSDMINEE